MKCEDRRWPLAIYLAYCVHFVRRAHTYVVIWTSVLTALWTNRLIMCPQDSRCWKTACIVAYHTLWLYHVAYNWMSRLVNHACPSNDTCMYSLFVQSVRSLFRIIFSSSFTQLTVQQYKTYAFHIPGIISFVKITHFLKLDVSYSYNTDGNMNLVQ